MTPLPSGTVTFLLTDVERSTRSWESGGTEMGAAIARLESVIEAAVTVNGGVVVKSRGEGDSSFAVFPRATGAVAAALAIQLEAPLKVRVGVHTGEAELRDGDYYGLEVNRSARLRDAAHGGQTLVSAVTAELLRDGLPPGASLLDHGAHRLRDLSRAEHVYELRHPELADAPRGIRSPDEHANNLPQQLTSFVGRAGELQAVRRLLTEHRLVTLTGVGGCGKTRLALETAAQELGRFADGVFLCDLSALTDPDAVARQISENVGMSLGGVMGGSSRRPVRDDLTDFLRDKRVLVVLDNCEHLVDACADIVSRLLAAAPRLHILATSREALGVDGEQSYTVPSLDVAGDAVRLFRERASSARAGFEASSAVAADIVRICERLDGIPLAIELAAAQVAHLSPAQIADRLGDRFRLLTGARRRVQRQQTLQAAMDWSYGLLAEAERVLLRRLSVFAGGLTLEAAEEVCGDDVLSSGDVLGLLASLVSKSLVIAEPAGAHVRYRLLETVRLYAESKLVDAGEAERFRDCHRDWFVEWVQTDTPEDSFFDDDVIAALEGEWTNIRAAVEWSLGGGRADLVGRVVAMVGGQLQLRRDEAVRWTDAVLAADVPDEIRLACLAIAAQSATLAYDPAAASVAQQAIDLADGRPGLPLLLALTSKALATAVAAAVTGDVALWGPAYDAADAAVAFEDAMRGTSVYGFAASTAATVRMLRLDLEGALDVTERMAAATDVAMPAFGLNVSRVVSLHLLGRHAEARTAAHILAARQVGASLPPLQTQRRWALALVTAHDGDDAGARQLLEESTSAARRTSTPLVLADCVACLGAVAAMRGDFEVGARLLAASFGQGVFRTHIGFAVYRTYVQRVRQQLGPERARTLRDEGRTMSLDEAIDYGLSV